MIRSIHNYVCTPIEVKSSRLETLAILCIQPAHFLMAICTDSSVSKMSYLKGKWIRPVKDWVSPLQEKRHTINTIEKIALSFYGIITMPLTLVGFGLHMIALSFNEDVLEAHQQLEDFRKHRILFNALGGNYEYVEKLLYQFPPDVDSGEIFGKHRDTQKIISDPETFNQHFDEFQKLLHASLSICQQRFDKINWTGLKRSIYMRDSLNLIYAILNACPQDRIGDLLGDTWSEKCLSLVMSELYFNEPNRIKHFLKKLPQELIQKGLSTFSLEELKQLFNTADKNDDFEIVEELFEKAPDVMIELLLRELPAKDNDGFSLKPYLQLITLSIFLRHQAIQNKLNEPQRTRITEFLLKHDTELNKPRLFSYIEPWQFYFYKVNQDQEKKLDAEREVVLNRIFDSLGENFLKKSSK